MKKDGVAYFKFSMKYSWTSHIRWLNCK